VLKDITSPSECKGNVSSSAGNSRIIPKTKAKVAPGYKKKTSTAKLASKENDRQPRKSGFAVI